MPKEFEIVGVFSETVYAHVELPDTTPDSALQLARDGVLNVIRTALDPEWTGEPLRVEPQEKRVRAVDVLRKKIVNGQTVLVSGAPLPGRPQK